MTTDAGRTGTARPRDADATRQALLRAAMRRFTLVGYDRTTTRDIAADAGANVSLIARYFGSKDGLFAAVLRESEDAVVEEHPTGPGLVDGIVDGLDPGAWPEFGGEHPLLLLVRDAGESDRVTDLRRRALRVAVDRLATQAAAERPGPSGRGRSAETRLRGELLLAVVTGLLTVRSAVPDGELAHATTARLRALVEALVDTVAPPATGA